jgi:glucose/arabinose dehydrogenase
MQLTLATRSILSSTCLVLLAGCGMNSSTSNMSGTMPAPTSMQGKVVGGQQPVSASTVQLYAVGTTGDGSAATPLTISTTTDANGNFTIPGYTCPTSITPVYITATGGNPGLASVNPAISLMTALGPCGSLSAIPFIQIDERTTVAAINALAPFMSAPNAIGSSAIDLGGLATAFTLASALVDPSTSQIPGPTLPANTTAPTLPLNTLADVLAACVNTTGGTAGDTTVCGRLFTATTPSGGASPTNTAAAALNIMRDPQSNAANIFALNTSSAPFQPQLLAAPADWTLPLTGTGAPAAVTNGCSAADLTGSSSFTNYMLQQPQICRKLLASDLPAANPSDNTTNYSTQVPRAPGQMPIVPPGFKVTLYASGFSYARYLLAAANGDLFLAQPSSGNIILLRGVDANGAAVSQYTYTSGLDSPYSMVFYPSAASPQYLYVSNTTTVVRFPYALGDTAASAPPTTLITGLPDGGHITRSLVFTAEAMPRLLIGVGSNSNVTNTDTDPAEYDRANILAYSVSGAFQSIYASGLRNPVGLTISPTGIIWTSVNERDQLGDNVPADYVTHVQEGGFYGWPWYYNGPNLEPRLPDSHPELAAQTIIGDTLLQPHFAPLQITFYTGTQFPTPYRGDIFVASHGSWNKSVRGGYELLRVHLVNGIATGEYEDFMTGFVNPDGTIWGRPAGVATGADGALYVADDTSNTIWRITYTGN